MASWPRACTLVPSVAAWALNWRHPPTAPVSAVSRSGVEEHRNEKSRNRATGSASSWLVGRRPGASEKPGWLGLARSALALESVPQLLGRAGAGDPGSERPDVSRVALG